MRNPQRTASTAAALMIGLALVTVVAMLAASILASFFDAVNKIWQTDYAVTAQNNYSPIPVSVSDPLRNSPVTTQVVGVRAGEARFLGATHSLTAVDPGASQVFNLDWYRLTVGDGEPRRGRRLYGRRLREGERPRDRLEGRRPVPQRRETAVHDQGHLRSPERAAHPSAWITISSAAFDKEVQQPKNLFVFINTKGGETDANTAALEKSLDGLPEREAAEQEEFKDNQVERPQAGC